MKGIRNLMTAVWQHTILASANAFVTTDTFGMLPCSNIVDYQPELSAKKNERGPKPYGACQIWDIHG